jgi:hypothetical protein
LAVDEVVVVAAAAEVVAVVVDFVAEIAGRLVGERYLVSQ